MNKRKILSLAAMAVLVFASSCNKLEDFGDTNVNPNGVSKPILSALFTNVSVGIPGFATQTRGGYYAQFFSETQYSDASLYAIPQLSFTGLYSGSLYDLQNIININESNNLTQAARILKSYIFWTITDSWGDVPYSQALQGGAVPNPVYDKQEDIYKGLLAELTSAVSSFDNTSFLGGDVSSYNGNIAKWKKLGNSLRILIALRTSKKYPSASGEAATAIKAALADPGGVISTNADNYSFSFPGGNLSSPWYGLYNGRKDVGESATMTALMGTLSDARQTVYGTDESGAPSTTGVPYGWSRNRVDPWTQANPKWTYVLKPSLRTQTGSVVVIPAAVVTLARAEAADRGWTTENAKVLYETGIKLSFEQWGVAPPSDAYFTQSAVAFSAPVGTGANLKQIATQRYVATYPDGLQAWAEWRRTGFPVLTPAPDALNASKQIPRRYTYATSEYLTNKASVEAAAALLPGGDVQDAKVWWDQ
ncbi:MAG: SusD/RagB family nutrient-binding outer membrane lipoprotein [Bacteroidota bacterium]